MLFQFNTAKSFSIIFCTGILEYKAMLIRLKRMLVIFAVFTFFICTNNLQSVHNFIMYFIRNKKENHISYLHFLSRFFPITKTKVTNTTNVIYKIFKSNKIIIIHNIFFMELYIINVVRKFYCLSLIIFHPISLH